MFSPRLAARTQLCQRSLFPSSILPSPRLYVALPRVQLQSTPRYGLLSAIGAVGLGLGLSTLLTPPIHCEGSPPPAAPRPLPDEDPMPPQPPPPPPSSVSVYELSFGTIAGICAGVFIKKGAKAVAFFLGGVFVLLQYFGSFGLLKVDWQKMGTRFQSLFYTRDPKTGATAPPTIYSLWTWLVDFLCADFQPRASFLAGLALGLRIG
ncbi:FUN14 family-domain-containing protein [Mycena sp. CBHHK59/15]|nr:FUN14 family-domain-containing protein [Mycena sp. CBHHK59/15]